MLHSGHQHLFHYVTMSAYPEYSLNNSVTEFLSQTSANREACDTKAKDLVGGKVIPVTGQGNCSYSVHAGPEFEFVVQFHLKSLMLRSETVTLARQIYGPLAPNAEFHGQLGEDGRESLWIYVMNRIPGISYLEFVLANGFPKKFGRELCLGHVGRGTAYFSSVFSHTPNRTTKMLLHFLKESANWLQFFCPLLGKPLNLSIQITGRIYAEHISRICSCYSTVYHLVFTR